MSPTIRGQVVRCRRAGCSAAHTTAVTTKMLAELGGVDPERLERVKALLQRNIAECPVPRMGASVCPMGGDVGSCPLVKDLRAVEELVPELGAAGTRV